VYSHQAPTFRDYIRPAWDHVEPATPFVPGFHIGAIAEHLQAISDGQLQNLIINIPPRHGKSSLVAVLWPTWEWISRPELRWLFASYGLGLSIRDSLKCRRLIESPWYQSQWGDRYQLTSDQNQKARFENSRTGYRVATSVGGLGTGEGGDRIVVDDPTSEREAESDASREGANDWWDGTMSTRGNNPATVARVIIMQRLHERDLTGHILERMQEGGEPYDHLVLPAEYEPRITVCMAGLEHDQRTEPGEPLSPLRFPTPKLEVLKTTMGERKAAGQLQQRPAPAGGAVFKREWWAEGRNRYDATDERQKRLATHRWLQLDTAFKKGTENDYTACSVFEMSPARRLRLREVWEVRLEFPELLSAIQDTAVRWRWGGTGADILEHVVIEDKGSGISAVQTLKAGAPDWLAQRIRAFTPVGDKVYRANQAAQWCALNMVELPHPDDAVPWLLKFEQQLEPFPAGAHDDQVDSFVQGILWVTKWLEAALHAPTPLEVA
jgi:predicted phage terminase large subunit-like protein